MLNYKDYLRAMLDRCHIMDEEVFNDVIKNFKDYLTDVAWEDFDPDYDNIYEFLLQLLIGNDCAVTLVDDDVIQLDAYFETLKELEKAKDIANKVGFTIENYNELLEDLDENSPTYGLAVRCYNELSESEKESFKKFINL